MNDTSLVSVLAALLASGCFLVKKDTPPDAGAAMAPQCEAQMQKLHAYCAEFPDQVPEAAVTHIKGQRDALVMQCKYAPTDPAVVEVDGCVAGLEGRSNAQGAEASTRQAAAADKVPHVKADPKYQEILATWKGQSDDAQLACDDAEDRRRARMDNATTAQRKCDRVTEELRATEAQMRAILESHGIDPRDAPALGLW